MTSLAVAADRAQSDTLALTISSQNNLVSALQIFITDPDVVLEHRDDCVVHDIQQGPNTS